MRVIVRKSLADALADGRAITAEAKLEQEALKRFLKKQLPDITAYFHGNSNSYEFYDWTGPRHLIRLQVFRVDSRMKGHYSVTDETRALVPVATIDTSSLRIDGARMLWNGSRRGVRGAHESQRRFVED